MDKTISDFLKEEATVKLTIAELGVLQSALSYAASKELQDANTMKRLLARLDATYRAKVDEYFEYNQ